MVKNVAVMLIILNYSVRYGLHTTHARPNDLLKDYSCSWESRTPSPDTDDKVRSGEN